MFLSVISILRGDKNKLWYSLNNKINMIPDLIKEIFDLMKILIKYWKKFCK